MYKLISFYTDTWKYNQCAENLANDCNHHNIDHHIEKLEDQGSWLKNTRLKPKFIYSKIKEFNMPVLWVDVDSRIIKPPYAIDLSYDVGAVRAEPQVNKTWAVGVIFFNNTDVGINFAKSWAESGLAGTDHAAFEDLGKNGFEGRFLELPKNHGELSKIFDDTVISIGISSSDSKREFYKSYNPNSEKRLWKTS